MAIIIGIPYPNYSDLKIKAKKKFFDQKNKYKFSNWYNQTAFIAINQAVGRIKRHLNDYGSILLIDSRYDISYKFKDFTDYLKELVEDPSDFDCFERELEEFYLRLEGNDIEEESEEEEFEYLISDNEIF